MRPIRMRPRAFDDAPAADWTESEVKTLPQPE